MGVNEKNEGWCSTPHLEGTMNTIACFVLVVANFAKKTFKEEEFQTFEEMLNQYQKTDDCKMFVSLNALMAGRTVLRPLWKDYDGEWVYKGLDGEMEYVN